MLTPRGRDGLKRGPSDLPGAGARFWRPGLGAQHFALPIEQLKAAWHLDRIVAQKQCDSVADVVLYYATTGVRQAYAGDPVTMHGAAEAQEAWPTPTAEVGPRLSYLGFGSASSPCAPIGVPTSVGLAHSTEYTAPVGVVDAFELNCQHRSIALNSFLQEADGLGPSLVRMTPAINGSSPSFGPALLIDGGRRRGWRRRHGRACDVANYGFPWGIHPAGLWLSREVGSRAQTPCQIDSLGVLA